MSHKKMKRTFSRKVVVITGSSSGAGQATALEFARYGAKLYLAARRKDLLEEVAAKCVQLGGRAVAVQADVTDAHAMRRLAGIASQYNGAIDVWFNNAGVLAAGEFDSTPAEVHDQVIRTNLLGYMHGAHAVLPYFKKQQYGILVNNISVGGWVPAPYGVAYTASKFGLRGFSESLRAELAKWPHIHICDLYPAFLDTPGVHHAANYTGHVLRPAPPVYDPRRVARAVVALALNPRKQKAVGSAAIMLRVAHFVMPSVTRFVAVWAVDAYLKRAAPSPLTTGNLFDPMETGSGIHGGWQKSPVIKGIAGAALLLTSLATGLMLVRRKFNST